MIRILKRLFNRGECEKCGWLVACSECSERMRQVDSELSKKERTYTRRKKPRYFSKGRLIKGPFAGLVDKGSFVEVLKQVLADARGEAGGAMMLTVTLPSVGLIPDSGGRQEVMKEVAQRIVSQVRHEDFVARFDELTFALLLVDSGEGSPRFEICAQRIKDSLAHPLVGSGPRIELDCRVRNISLRPGTTLDDIHQQMDF